MATTSPVTVSNTTTAPRTVRGSIRLDRAATSSTARCTARCTGASMVVTMVGPTPPSTTGRFHSRLVSE